LWKAIKMLFAALRRLRRRVYDLEWSHIAGPAGPAGSGTAGAAATIAVGSTTTLSSGSSATVTNAGSSSAAILDFGIPAGVAGSNGTNGTNGSAATISVGTTTTLSAGSSATVTNAGSSSAAVFDFGIPAGATGATGPAGPAFGGTEADLVNPVTLMSSETVVLSTGSIGGSGQTWLVVGTLVMFAGSTGVATLVPELVDSGGTIHALGAAPIANSSYATVTIFAVLALSGAITVNLSCSQNGSGTVLAQGTSTYGVPATKLAWTRLA
jgi:hypothetical protein